MDKNISYLLKSFDHIKEPWTQEDKAYYQRLLHYVASKSWLKKPALGGITTNTRLAFIGDMMWIRSGWEKAISPAILQQLSTANITLANLETPIVPNKPVPKWVYETLRYNSPPEFLNVWRDLKPNSQHIFSICNNHALDQDEDGLTATRNTILANPNFFCLGGMQEEDKTAIIEVNGIRIAFLALSFGINHLAKQQAPPAGIPLMSFGNPQQEPDWPCLINWVSKVKEQNVDLLIVMPHWGYEYEYWPDALFRDHAHRLIEIGFDVIIGTSPHVLQPLEIVSINNWDEACPVQIQRPGKSQFGIIAYSLGNFLTIMPTLACKVGAFLQIDVARTHDQHIHLLDLKVIPTFSERGLDTEWLAAKVVTLEELKKIDANKSNAAVIHARQFFDSFS